MASLTLRNIPERRQDGESVILIAAVALDRELILATGNLKHFAGVPGLRVERWLES